MTRSLLRDEGGAALVEFVLVAPLLFLLFFGSVEVVEAVEAQRRVAHVASAIADVVAQDQKTDDAQLAQLFSAGASLMAPFPTSSLGQRVSSFTADEDGVAQLDWTSSGAPYGGDAPLTLPDGYLDPGESVIVADVSYRYEPALTLAFGAALPLQKRVYLRPRLSDRVVKQG